MSMTADANSLTLNGLAIEVIARGSGNPLLFLHAENGLTATDPVIDALAKQARVVAPVHPAFSAAPVPSTFNTVDDLAYFYLDLIERLDLRGVTLVGASFGGWIAAEMAIKCTARIGRVVLVNPVGIKVSPRETRDIADIFALMPDEFDTLAFHDPAVAKRDYKAMADDEVRDVARAREATARYGWSPYLHDPKLKGRLHRINVPALILWGASDRIASED